MPPRTTCAAAAAVVALSLFFVATSVAQTTRPNASAVPSDPDPRLDRFERRLDELEQKHQADLKSRDEEIARLRDELRRLQTLPGAPATHPGAMTGPEQGVLGEIDKIGKPTESADPIEKTKQDVLKDIEANRSSPLTLRTPVSFNPDLAVVTNFKGSVSTNNDNSARNRFDVGSVELDLRAAIDPRADGVAIIPISRDVADPLFFDKATAERSIDTGVDIEEAYMFLHDFGVPNLTAKLGRFHLRFGRQNILHEHDWPTVDNNFVNQSFLGHESLNDSGLSLSYVVPTQYTAGQYVEAIVEVISGEGSTDDPVLNNDAYVRSPAVNAHLIWNTDLTRDWNLELGGSFLSGKHNDDSRQTANLYGMDLTLIHTDPTGKFFNQLIEAEAIYGDVDTSRRDTQHAYGAYLLFQQQLNRDWYAGCRLDWTKNALNDRQEVWGVSPYITWYWSEFLRWRLEYQHKAGDVPNEDTVYFQATWIFGAHPPHPYWALK